MIEQKDHAVEVFVCLLAVLQLLVVAIIARENTIELTKMFCCGGAVVYFCFAVLYTLKEMRAKK